MPRQEARPITRGIALRGLGLALGIALLAVGVWLIATGTSTKSVRLGSLAGIWGAVVAGGAIFASRRSGIDDRYETGSVPDTSTSTGPAADVALRGPADIERAADAAARREFEQNLQRMIRLEITNAVNREVSDLRDEIAKLRQEVVEKVGGQLRLERIETTRLIGSDLEALHHEVRMLKDASETPSLNDLMRDQPLVRAVSEHSVVHEASASRPTGFDRPVAVDETGPLGLPPLRRRDPIESPAPVEVAALIETPVAGEPVAPEPTPEPAVPEPTPEPAVPEPTPEPAVPEPVPEPAVPEPIPEPVAPEPIPDPALPDPTPEPPLPEPAAEPVLKSPFADDPFASLPRITPFTAFELDPIITPSNVDANGSPYTGRRRRSNEADDGGDDRGRHSQTASAAQPSRRHRRTDESGDGEELLARLIARGSSER